MIDVRQTGERFLTRTSWLDSRHSFSFGRHYDPGNTHFGKLLVSNHDVVAAGTGFETHPHQDMEILTWVLSGVLVHQDSTGHNGLIHPGLAQRMSAGRGILHSEKNDSVSAVTADEPVEFVQMWVIPETAGNTPGYAQLDVTSALASGDWVPVASGASDVDAAIRIAQPGATLLAARPAAGQRLVLPESAFVHAYVARGSVVLEGAGELSTGDAARITGGGQRLSAGDDGAEVLVWAMS